MAGLRDNSDAAVTTFVGREAELAALTRLLADPSCRLLTLTGVGGVGKTQLALKLVGQIEHQFPDGADWVDLQPVSSGDYLIPAIADAVGAMLSGQENLEQQLCRYLEKKQQLLALDNFEHLLEHVEVLPMLLRRAPGIKLLVTSREALNLQEEWLYPVSGLSLPASYTSGGLEVYDAVRLFVERAQRMRADFSLENEQAGVVRICQLVEGMPLAIEMAAAWTKSLRCSAIAAEIQHNVKFLTSRLHNVPERHRSMEAVFAQTWDRLSDDARVLFRRLAVFRGGFQPEAAQIIANASLTMLASLLDKSLLQRDSSGRYHLHELLRQFAESQFERDEAQQVALAHCQYYADFCGRWERELIQGDQVRADAEIETELGNIRAAWQTALQQRHIAAIGTLARMLFFFGQLQGRYLELAGILEPALPVLEGSKEFEALAQIQVYLGWMLIRLGRLERAAIVLEQSRSLFEARNLTPEYGMGTHPLAPLVILDVVRGRYAEAMHTGERLLQVTRRLDNQHNLVFACYGLTSAYLNLGEYDKAYQYARQAATLCGKLGNRWLMAYCLNEWGRVASAMGRHAEAEQHYRVSYQIRQGFRDPEGVAVVLNHLGELALLRRDYPNAHDLYTESLSIYEKTNDQGGLATAHQGLGQVAVQTGASDQAVLHLSEALAIAARIEFMPRVLSILIDIGGLLLRSDNQTACGMEALRVVIRHPASNQEQRSRAASLLGNEHAADSVETPDLDSLLLAIPIALSNLRMRVEGAARQPLVEPLTERELEILRLLGDGMTNEEIGRRLVIAVGTVKAHTSRIYGKLGVRNRVEAIAKGRELSLLDPP